MIKTTLSLIFFSISLIAFSQTYYDQGTQYLQTGDYEKADSMLTLAIEAIPFGDAYYNRAIARMKMDEMAGFCIDIKKAASYNDNEAEKLHIQYCLDIDTINYSDTYEIVENISSFVEIVNKEKYYDLTEGFVYDKSDNQIARYRIQNDYKWYGLVPNMPEFEGGERKMLKFLKSNLVYPDSERDAYKKYAGTYATVYVQFDISESGKVTNVQVSDEKKEHTEKNISRNFVNEALRIVRLLPDFKPENFKGEPVIVRNVIPIKFDFPK
jgi:protein TonB